MKKMGIIILILLFVFGVWKLCCIKWEVSEDVVSGIVYDATFNENISGNTYFKIRASAEMAVSEKTSREYCLPPDHEDTEVVRKAAGDKRFKVVVTTDKYFGVSENPWDCPNNVHVKEIEEDE